MIDSTVNQSGPLQSIHTTIVALNNKIQLIKQHRINGAPYLWSIQIGYVLTIRIMGFIRV